MRIKLFEDFSMLHVLDEVDQCLVDLRDNGFEIEIFREPNNTLFISLYRIDRKGFTKDEIADSVETMIEYFDEKYVVKSYSITKPDSPGPGIEVKLDNRWHNKIFYLNIKIKLGK
jgi:hypothetical protein